MRSIAAAIFALIAAANFALIAAAPGLAWGQVAVRPIGGAPLNHLRIDGDSFSAGPAGNAGAARDVRTQWELGAEVSRQPASRDMDARTAARHGRWFLFAAAGGQAVGLNMQPAAGGSRWSSGSASTMINDGQAGFGWRRGSAQAAFGYVHREISGQDFDPYSARTRNLSDSMVGLSFSLHSR
jgi:hypothetical protein